MNWLYDLLVSKFGADLIFKDVDNIKPGEDFVEELTSAVISCDVLLAVIGPDWLTVSDGQGTRRLDDPNDWVRLELEIALARGVRVIPLLVEGAKMPIAADLPPKLAPLVRRQAHELSPHHFKRDAALLLESVDEVLQDKKASWSGSDAPNGQPRAGQPGTDDGARFSAHTPTGENYQTVISQPGQRRSAPGEDSAAGSVQRRPKPRWWVVLGGVALVIAAILVGSALINPRAGSVTPPTGPTTPPAASKLPQSAQPLGADVLVLRVSRGDDVWQLVTVDLRGRVLNVLAKGGSDLISPVISPDRRTVLYRDELNGVRTLRAVSADGTQRRALFSDGPACLSLLRPALTRNNLLVMPCGSGTNTTPESLRLLSLDGDLIKTLDEGVHLGDVTASPVGDLVVYWRDESPKHAFGGALFAKSLTDDSAPRQLTTGAAGQDAQAVMSPRGNRVIFSRLEDGRRSLQVLDHLRPGLDNFHPLMDGTANEEDPSWSPDGKRVAFRSQDVKDADSRGFTKTARLVVVSESGESLSRISKKDDVGIGAAWTSR